MPTKRSVTGAAQTSTKAIPEGDVKPWTRGSRVVGYDPARRRVWLAGQRMHHGATGILLAAAGVLLVAHDWKDRSVWFRFGPQAD
jgi:hypothetical protein